MKNTEKITLGSLVDRFKQIYALGEAGLTEHEGIHAMTGMGISIADEMRVAIYEIPLTHIHQISFQDALRREKEIYDFLTHSMKHEWKSWIEENKLATVPFRKLQAQTLRLDKKEIKEHYDLAKKINDAVLRLTGKPYRELTAEEVRQLNFRGLDFTAQAHAIKRKHEKPENRKIEEKTAEIFFWVAARACREEDIPAPGTPWHGKHKQRYKLTATPL